AGAVAEPLRVSYYNGTSWTPFAKVPRTWNLGGAFDVAAAGGGTHLVATVDNSSYYPQVAAWTGAGFGKFQLTGDKNSCAPRSHDLVTDRSGRLADVSIECTQLAVANQPQRKQAAVTRFPVGGTPTGEPQIVTTARGHGVVAWSRLSTTGQRLLAVGVRLPALTRKKTGKAKGGKVITTGPVSCMPASRVKVGVKAKKARGWKVASKSLRLDGKAARGRVDGAQLKPGSAHKLVGKATFKKAGSRSTATAVVKFRACPNG
ncbi:hypothetical protein, partial [Nocardioides sp.]|uniref:hypothetical protein n=1 Tax=Nocardioides sp. TaxID=35761 RepID=UPI0027352E03